MALLLFFVVDAQLGFVGGRLPSEARVLASGRKRLTSDDAGLAGGITYVNAYRLIQESVEPMLKELATAGVGQLPGVGFAALRSSLQHRFDYFCRVPSPAIWAQSWASWWACSFRSTCTASRASGTPERNPMDLAPKFIRNFTPSFFATQSHHPGMRTTARRTKR
eukprot:scaffold184_cov316-Pinguiococcus_pyrenoidosus.AAC.31